MNRTSIIIESLWYFFGGAIVLFVAVQYGIPRLNQNYGVAPLIGWWLTSGIMVFALFVGAFLAARHRANAKSLREILFALNIRSLDKTDTQWAFGGLLGVVVLTGIVVAVFDKLFSLNLLSQDSYASFLRMEKLKPEEYWLFLAWLPYFFFNIVGEELMWRGYLLPPISCGTGSVRLDSKRCVVGDFSRGNWLAHRHRAIADRVHRSVRCPEKAKHLAWDHHSRTLQWKWFCNGSSWRWFLSKLIISKTLQKQKNE
jgi:membrane protease YdiL (CAAX protease family)